MKELKDYSSKTVGFSNEQVLSPKGDGKLHINIYSKAKTALGRALSNFSFNRFTHDELGNFSSMEGLYFYVSTGMIHGKFRKLHGITAQKNGRELPRVPIEKEEFYRLMRIGCRCVYRDNPRIHDMILDQLIINKGALLPFVHYYVYNGEVKPVGSNEWLTEEWSKIRLEAIQQAGGTLASKDGLLYAIGLPIAD